MTDATIDLDTEIATLRAGCLTVLLATVSADGEPEASYAPYVDDGEGGVVVLLSRLSRHTRDLLAVPRASVLFIEAESATRQIYARRRLTLACRAVCIPRDDPQRTAWVRALHMRFGEIVDVLDGLPDFEVFHLVPASARFVKGFGQAYARRGSHPWQPVGGPSD